MNAQPDLRRQPPPANEAPAVDWRRHLPADWREQVVAPLDFTEHREYEMPASRRFGYDVDGALCYYAHSYELTESRSDNDEDFYQVVTYGETVHAWRLRDERWLTWRVVHTGDDTDPRRGFYSFSDQPPR